MPQKRVEIILKKDGTVVVEAFGFKGPACTKATAFLDEIFKGQNKRTLKPSYELAEEEVEKYSIDGLPSGHCG